uniref:Uncharacterized protein n=1 Tax=Caenorhabditis japonica TaxID=281687 RepID=A0A8R1EKP3_CAEJA
MFYPYSAIAHLFTHLLPNLRFPPNSNHPLGSSPSGFFSVLTYRSILMYIDSNFLISHQSDIFASGPNFYYCTT